MIKIWLWICLSQSLLQNWREYKAISSKLFSSPQKNVRILCLCLHSNWNTEANKMQHRVQYQVAIILKSSFSKTSTKISFVEMEFTLPVIQFPFQVPGRLCRHVGCCFSRYAKPWCNILWIFNSYLIIITRFHWS